MVTELPDDYRDGVAHTTTSAIENSNPIEAGGIKIPRVLITFGSETGTAEAAAFNLAKLLKLAKPIVMPLNEVAGLNIVRERRITHLLAVTSTFGAGEAPSNATVFASTDISDGMLSETKVAVLALGSTLYPDFCKAGVFLDQQLSSAGGKSLMPLKKVDESTGSDGPIADWNALVSRLVLPLSLRTILENRVGGRSTPVRHELKWLSRPTLPPHEILRVQWPEDESCVCCENEELVEGGNVDARSTRKITFQLPKGATYVSGDHLAVQPLNAMDMVRRFGECFKDELATTWQRSGVDCADPVESQMQQLVEVDCIEDGERFPARLAFSTPATLGSALQSDIDFAIKSNFVKDFLSMIERELIPKQHDSEAGKDISNLHGFVDLNARLCSQLVSLIEVIVKDSGAKADHVDSFIQSFPTVVDLLETFGPILCASGVSKLRKGPLLTLANLLPMLQRLRPRHYSISSSNKTDPSKVSITVGVVHEKTTGGVMIHGVCSNYLARLDPKKDSVKVAIRVSNFRGPKSTKAPIVLVGAGTGLAPMMGFIQDRVYDVAAAGDSGKAGEAHLFFGCRSQNERIYAERVDDWVSSGVLQLHLALSREPGMPKKYVQQALSDYGPELCRLLLLDDTHYYICGDAKVGDKCYEVCIQVLRAYGNMSRVGAVCHINRMRVENRWQFDLWGVIQHFVEAKREIKKEKEVRSASWLRSFKWYRRSRVVKLECTY
jgi:sulfite reductase alpha subunit-like flavoprotein